MDFETFIKYKKDFLVYLEIERNLSKHTYSAYDSDLKMLEQFWVTHKTEHDIYTILERFFVHLYHKKTEKSSIARKVSCFRSYERFVRSIGGTIRLKLTRPRVDKKLPTYLSLDEIEYLLDTLQDKDYKVKTIVRDKAIFETLYATGIRNSELVNIKISDIDFHHKTILITGKGDKQRVALFGRKAKQQIEKYIATERIKCTKKSDYLFINAAGKRLTTRTIQKICTMFSTMLPVSKMITPHKIRHSFATHLLNSGMNLRALQELLGHASLATTEKYTHISTVDLQKMYNTIHPVRHFKKQMISS